MIIKDEESLNEALQILESSPSGVRYSDMYVYITVSSPDTLEWLSRRALSRNDIAIVVPRGQEREMENYGHHLSRIRKQRAVKEKKDIKDWVREHPDVVEKFKRKVGEEET